MAEIGASLREARMRARIDITEVETRTKIRAKYLRAIENEEWDLLPGPVFAKSFLKTYADYLGLDSRLLLDEFRRRYENPGEHDARPGSIASRERPRERTRGERDRVGERRPSRVRSTLFSPASIIVVALVVIVAALYVIGSSGGGNSGNTTGKITPAGGSKHHKKKSSGKGKTHTDTGTTRSKTSTGTTTTGTSTTPTEATLKLVPTGTVWVCVEDAAGTTKYTGEYTDGETIPTAESSELLVGLGNNEVTITADGKSYTPTGTSAISLEITPTGVKQLTTTPPTCAA